MNKLPLRDKINSLDLLESVKFLVAVLQRF